MKDKTAVLIPSLSPDEKLLSAIKELRKEGFSHILVVNDGSAPSYGRFFDEAAALGAVVITHTVNQGKGRALKTGINHILLQWPQCKFVVTVDSDGQHKTKDVLRCLKALEEAPDSLVLGCRCFDKKSIPFRSRFGNIVTAKIMKLLIGLAISDTQTGLRAFSTENMRRFLAIAGERFEYEMNMLLYCKEEEIPLVEVEIETIYLEENKSSHFRPLQDSAKIYSLFLKYILSSFSSFLIDILLFTLFVNLFKRGIPQSYIVVSTVLARVISSVYNFFMNRIGVFKSKVPLGRTAIRYYTLAVIQMLISAGGVWALHQVLPMGESIVKIVVDTILFCISFQIQREWVYAKK